MFTFCGFWILFISGFYIMFEFFSRGTGEGLYFLGMGSRSGYGSGDGTGTGQGGGMGERGEGSSNFSSLYFVAH